MMIAMAGLQVFVVRFFFQVCSHAVATIALDFVDMLTLYRVRERVTSEANVRL